MSQKLFYTVSAVLFLCLFWWLYYPALGSYFANDDWVLLWHNRRIPLSQPWLFFNMHTIWFYRPLQSLQYGLTWHFAGMNHFLYGIQLLIMHLGVCLLVFTCVRLLFGIGIATLTTVLFTVSCLSPDIILWFPNVNTSQHALVTLGAACCFIVYLKSRSRRWMYATIALAVVNCFTKESCVNLPLVLGTVWITMYLQGRWSRAGEGVRPSGNVQSHLGSESVRGAAIHFLKDLSPFIGITLIYVICHKVFYVNIETWYLPKYGFAPPLAALGHLMYCVNMSLFGLVTYPLAFGATPLLGTVAKNVLTYAYVVPAIIIGVGFRLKQPAMIFAVLFAASLQFPTFALDIYDAGRYYYLSGASGALVLSMLCYHPLKLLSTNFAYYLQLRHGEVISVTRLSQRLGGYLASIILVAIITANVIAFQWIIGSRCQEGVFVEQAFKYIQAEGGKLPANSLIVLRLAPNNFFHNGMGVVEMVSLATGRTDVVGVSSDAEIAEELRPILRLIPNKYLLDIFTTQPKFIKVENLVFPAE